MLDPEGKVYREKSRDWKSELRYSCRERIQTWHPLLTCFGFRDLTLEEFPGEAKPEQFTAIAVYSDLRKTGHLRCGVPEGMEE